MRVQHVEAVDAANFRCVLRAPEIFASFLLDGLALLGYLPLRTAHSGLMLAPSLLIATFH
jgi:hypothetical protein